MLATAKPLLLVGGQAVNLWALYYQERTVGLTPFVSRDADVLGDRETLKALGKLAGTKPQFFPLRAPSNEVGVVIGGAELENARARLREAARAREGGGELESSAACAVEKDVVVVGGEGAGQDKG